MQCCKGLMVAAHVLVASLLASDTGVWTPTVVLGPAGWLCSTLWSRGLQAVQMGTRCCAFGPLLVSDGGSVFGQPSGACAAVVAAVPRRGVSVGSHAIVARSPIASHGSRSTRTARLVGTTTQLVPRLGLGTRSSRDRARDGGRGDCRASGFCSGRLRATRRVPRLGLSTDARNRVRWS